MGDPVVLFFRVEHRELHHGGRFLGPYLAADPGSSAAQWVQTTFPVLWDDLVDLHGVLDDLEGSTRLAWPMTRWATVAKVPACCPGDRFSAGFLGPEDVAVWFDLWARSELRVNGFVVRSYPVPPGQVLVADGQAAADLTGLTPTVTTVIPEPASVPVV